MNSSINIAEILIVNSTGVFILLFLIGSKYANKSTKRVGEYLFSCMIILNILTLIMETLSFLIDGMPGKFIHILQYFSNALLIFGAPMMGYIWCLFVEFKIHRSLKRVNKIAFVLAIPAVMNALFVVLDCFGAGLLFAISKFPCIYLCTSVCYGDNCAGDALWHCNGLVFCGNRYFACGNTVTEGRILC